MKGLTGVMMQRAAGALVLCAALLAQVQVVYACAHLDLQAQKDCCCDHASSHPCPMVMDPGTHCCETKLAIDQDHGLTEVTIPPRSELIQHNAGAVLPPAIALADNPYTESISAHERPPDTFWDPRSDTYLLTLRFRE